MYQIPNNLFHILVEFFVTEGDSIWNLSEEEVFELALPHFEQLGLFTRKEVRTFYSFKKSHVYPVYDLAYKNHLAVIKKYLDSFTNLCYIGRPGRFQYNNQDHSLEMGIVAAKSILAKKRYDFDDIGTEKEYFEQGTLRQQTK